MQSEKNNLWDRINGITEAEPIQEPEPIPEDIPEPEPIPEDIPETEPVAEELAAEQPTPAPKKKITTKRWLIPAIAAVLALSVGLTLFFTRPKPPKPQPEELVSVWLLAEQCQYNDRGGLEERVLRTYDENGNVLTYAVYMGEREISRSEQTYDEKNCLVEMVTYSNGQESYRYQYTWDFQGNQTKSVQTHQGKPYSEYEYIYGWKGELLTQLQTDQGENKSKRITLMTAGGMSSGKASKPAEWKVTGLNPVTMGKIA